MIGNAVSQWGDSNSTHELDRFGQLVSSQLLEDRIYTDFNQVHSR